MILAPGHDMAFGATLLGPIWHAIWAGIPLGLCVLAFTPPSFVDAIGRGVPVRQRRVIREDRRATGESAKSSATRIPRQQVRLDRREQLLLHQGQNELETGELVRSARWCSTT